MCRYLLHRTSGPFLDAALSHQTITLACLIYISQSLKVFGNAVDCAEFRSNMLNSHHSIHYYAYEYWLEHLEGGVPSTTIYPDIVSNSIATHFQGILTARKPTETIDARLLTPDSPSGTRTFLDGLPYRGDIVEIIRLLLSFHSIAKKDSLDHENLGGQSPNLCSKI